MPYISRERQVLVGAGAPPENVGELTFAFQQSIKKYLEGDRVRYKTLAEVLGALEGAKADFIDRVLLPYEAKKRQENGDVWT